MDLKELLEPLDIAPPRRRPWMYAVAFGSAALVLGAIWLLARPGDSGIAAAPTTTAVSATTVAGSQAAPVGSEDATTTTAAPTTTTEARPPDLTVEPPPSTPIEILADDGTVLAGTLFSGGSRGILVTHEFDLGIGGPIDTDGLLPIAAEFARKGYTVLLFEHRGHGASTAEPNHRTLVSDIADAYGVLADVDGVAEIDVFAWGVGGTAAMIAADDNVIAPRSIAVMFARPQFSGLDAQRSMATFHTPILFITVDAGRSTQWARKFIAAAPDDAVTELAEFPAPSINADPLRDFWPEVVERVLDYFASTR